MAKKEKVTETRLLKIPANKLSVGMYVSQLDRPWLETPFALQGFPLHKESDVRALRDICEFVYIDTLKSRYLLPESRTDRNPSGQKRKVYVSTERVEDEIKVARVKYGNSLAAIHDILDKAGNNESLNTRDIQANVRDCVDSIERNPSAMMWLTRIKHVDAYTAEHCLNVGLLAIALGRHLGLGRECLEMLGLSGMLHDVGKMRLDQTILNKPDRLTAEEFEHVKLHTVYGLEILRDDRHLSPEVIEAAYSHHERIDGRGYPRAISARDFHLCTKIVTIVDAYDAITSRRIYSGANNSATGLKILYQNRGTQFDEELVVKFIECIGIYPPGTIVEMTNGEVGIVISADPRNRLLPRVCMILDAGHEPVYQYVVDLQEQRKHPQGPQHHIKYVHPDGVFGINLETFTNQNIWIREAIAGTQV